ncbi:MAG: SusD/RagB family nutrient-binding outer membrane lipoprotein [Dysgonamonadaceae bacterium]
MKKYIFLIGSLFLFFSCMDDNMNKDPFGADSELMNRTPVGSSQLANLQKLVLPEQENSYQMCFDLFATNYAGYASTTKFFSDYVVYNPRTSWVSYPFDDTYPKIYTPFRFLYETSGGDYSKIYYSWGTILRIGITQWLTDTYGPLPYSRVLGGKIAVPYDDQKSIYLEMCSELQKSIEAMKVNYQEGTLYKSYDLVYGGNFSKWLKYANSLLLRLSVRMSKAAPAEAKMYAEYAVDNGVITANSDNAALSTTNNPVNIVSNLWGDSRVNAEITEYMRAFSDPRREKYFSKVTSRTGDYVYFGLRSGINPSTVITPANYSTPNVTEKSPIIWISASEVAFLMAEGALKGWKMGDTAENLYKKGITLSFEQWGASSLSDYLNNSVKRGNYVDALQPALNEASFLSDITVKWSDANGDAEKQLAKIITQKWIAMFPYGAQEAWAEWRRTGYPNLMPTQVNSSSNTVKNIVQVNGKDTGGMRRLPYSQKEKEGNNANVQQGIQYLGGPDNGGSDLWWAK